MKTTFKLLAAAFASYTCAQELEGPTANGNPTYSDEEEMKVTDSALKHQSPINIRTQGWRKKRETFLVSGDEAFQYRYGTLSYDDAKKVGDTGVMFAWREEEKGHFRTSASSIFNHELKNMTFVPQQIHFHSGTTHANPGNMGSEHTYDGKHFDLEAHIVHFNLNEETKDDFVAAVIGIMFRASDTDKLTYADKFLRKLFSGEPVDTERDFVDHLDLIHRFIYRGSLTTPPYSEMLLWNMVARVAHINYETLKLFRHMVPLIDKEERMFGQPNRDVQPYNGRKIYEIIEGPTPHE